MAVKLNVNKKAFVPGEPLVYEFSIDNKSQNDVKEVEFILRQVKNVLHCPLLCSVKYIFIYANI